MPNLLPFRCALLQVADEADAKAADLERLAMDRAAEGRTFAPPPAPRVADLLLDAQRERLHAARVRVAARQIMF